MTFALEKLTAEREQFLCLAQARRAAGEPHNEHRDGTEVLDWLKEEELQRMHALGMQIELLRRAESRQIRIVEKTKESWGIKMKKRIYIAGPCTGLPDLNYPAFNAAAARLRALGHHVENPAENPEPPCKSWEGYMKLAIAQLVTCDTVALLPGWSESNGARIECRLAQNLKLNIVAAGEVIA